MLRYRLLILLLSLPLVLFTTWQAIRYRDLGLLLQRLGIKLPVQREQTVWLHAASVGEVNALAPFITLLQEKFPQQVLVVSTNTPTGKQVLQKRFPAIAHCYLAFDWLLAAKRFINSINPQCALVFETEIWPNLFSVVNKKQIPLVIFNGRISAKSIRGRARYADAYRHALQQVNAVLTRSEQDRENFILLGSTPATTHTVGNIKYASMNTADVTAIELARPYILAASTRDGEEKFIVDTLKQQLADMLLVIAPRHPQRRAEIESDLAEFKLEMAVRSRGETVTDKTKIYLADTLGELNQFIAGSQFVLMGGAFLPFGGHNILEVAQQGKAVIFGTHMDNFSNEAETLLANQAALQVSNQQELLDATRQLIDEPEQARQLGENAKAITSKNAGIAETYLNEIARYCKALH